MVEGVIFDMDGVIIDSEPLWAEVQNEVFTSLGLEFSEELAKKTIGTGTYDAIDFWYRQQPWQGATYEEVAERIFGGMMDLIRVKGVVMEGLIDVLDFFKAKNIKIGLASGSPLKIIHLVLDQLGIRDRFQVVHSVENEEFGKPHPGVFISAAAKMNVLPIHCMVIEDSFNGLIAAKAARMKAVALLANGQYKESRYDFADLKLKSLTEFKDIQFNYLQNLV